MGETYVVHSTSTPKHLLNDSQAPRNIIHKSLFNQTPIIYREKKEAKVQM